MSGPLGTGPPPGWYPDPAGTSGWRWWDGVRWDVRAYPPSEPGGVGTPIEVGRELRFAPWALAAVWTYVGAQVIGVVLAVIESPLLHRDVDYLRRVFDNASRGIQTRPPAPVQPAGYTLWLDLSALALIGGFVVFLVWQHRAAVAARSIGYPARHSPGFGVGSWFIPIVNLWLPYQAIRDFRAHSDETQRDLLAGWLLLIAGHLLTLATEVVSGTSGAGAAPMVLAIVVWLSVGYLLSGVVRRICSVHVAATGWVME